MSVLVQKFTYQQQGGQYLRANENEIISSNMLDGAVSIDVTSADVTLTLTPPDTCTANYAILNIIGSPTGDRSVIIPDGYSGCRKAIDNTTGGHTIKLKSGHSGSVGAVIPAALLSEFYCSGTEVTGLSVAISGPAGGDLIGTFPNPTLGTSGVSAGAYGDASHSTQVTFDAKGRATSASSVAIAIAQSAVTNLVSDLGAKAALASPTFTGTPLVPTAAPGTNTLQAASTAFVKAAIDLAVASALKFQNSTDCSGNPNYPAALKGDLYVVTVAGKIGGASGTVVDAGDVYFADADNAGGTEASVGTSWAHIEHNLVGVLLRDNNLSDLTNTTTARSSLGLGGAAVLNVGTSAGTVAAGDDARLTAVASKINSTHRPVTSTGDVLVSTDGYIGFTASGVLDFGLTTGGGAPQVVLFKNQSGSVHAVTITPFGTETIDGGGAGVAITLQVNDFAILSKDGTNWQSVARGNTAAAAVASVFGRTGAVVAVGGDYAVADITGAAPLASPTFTGTPLSTTAAVDTNTTQIATTAFVLAQASSATPLIDGTATIGTSTRFARGDHIHPTDTTRYRYAVTNAVGSVSGSVTPNFATSLTNSYTLSGDCTALPAPTNLADGETGVAMFTLSGHAMPSGPASGTYKGNWTVTGTLVRVIYLRVGSAYFISADSLTVVP